MRGRSIGGAMAETLHYICPTCGSDVEVGKPCPGCPKPKEVRKKRPKEKEGAKEKKVVRSWEQDKYYDGMDLPDDEFDAEDFYKRELSRMPHRAVGIRWYWWVLALVLVIWFFLWMGRVVPWWPGG